MHRSRPGTSFRFGFGVVGIAALVACGGDGSAPGVSTQDAGGSGVGGSGASGVGGSGGQSGDASDGSAGGDTGGTAGGQVQYQDIVVEVIPDSTPLDNPGIGIEQAATLMENGSVGRNKSLDGVAKVRYFRARWSYFEPADDQYDWSSVDAAIEGAAADGMQLAIAIIPFSPSATPDQAIPAWFKNDPRHAGHQCTGAGIPAGCTYYRIDITYSAGGCTDCDNMWVFNNDDPVYVAEQLELIEALRNRYDNASWAGKIAYVDVRSVGWTGEWHTCCNTLVGSSERWPMPSTSTKQAIIDAHLAFDYLPQVIPWNDRDFGWGYACSQGVAQSRRVGWRVDSIDTDATKIEAHLSGDAELSACWRNGPVYGEPHAPSIEGMQTAMDDVEALHLSGWNNKYDQSYGSDPAYTALVDSWRTRGGYRLAAVGGSVPSLVAPGAPFDISVDLTNLGNAPVYRSHYALAIRFELEQGGDALVVPLDGDLTSVFPGGPVSFTASGASIPTEGRYGVSVGVVQDQTIAQPSPLRLANTDCAESDGTYWCNVGSVEVVEAQ